MAEPVASTGSSTPVTVVPFKRVHEESEPAQPVLSPLNPDFAPSFVKGPRAAKEKAPMHREPREKKESLKKREAKGGSAPAEARATPDRNTTHAAKRKAGDKATPTDHLGPLRYKLPPPRSSDYDVPKDPVFTLHHSVQAADGAEVQFYESSEQ